MSIEITIIYSPEGVRINQPSYTFPDEGGTLGRASNNFWTLEDPNKYMSSVHAKIEYQTGQYFLTDISTNGTFINGASEPVGNGNQVLLNEGDRFTISDYEFVAKLNNASVSMYPFPTTDDNDSLASLINNSDPFSNALSDTSDVFTTPAGKDPFSDFPVMASNSDPFATLPKTMSIDGILSVQTEVQTDPLALLNKATPYLDPFSTANSASDIFSSNNFSNNNFSEFIPIENNGVMNDSISWPVASPESSLIPDDWDDWDKDLGFDNKASISRASSLQGIPSDSSLKQEKNPFQSTVNTSGSDTFSQQPLASEDSADILYGNDNSSLEVLFASTLTNNDIAPAQENLSVQNLMSNGELLNSTAENLFASPVINLTESAQHTMTENKRTEVEYINLEQQNQQLKHQVAELKLKLASVQKIKASANVNLNADTTMALNMVVDAMGLSKWNLPDSKKVEINETVGLLIIETMQGMMQVLKFRKKIKEEFRINVTTIQSVENNPLKFSANIEDALENMFIKENNAYKDPVDAVREGFQSIAEHQVAVVAGMQVAFRGMIERFDPDNLESRFEKYKSTGLLSLGKRTKCWNAYKEYHQELVGNLDDSFQYLFGYDFVQTYEEKMNSLISSRVNANVDTKNT